MADYPNTKFTDGVVDDAFGGIPANRYGAPQRSFQDAQVRELQTQARDMWWSGRPVQRLPMASAGVAGDVVVFDTNGAAIGGGPTYRTIANGGYTQDQTPLVGVLVEPASLGKVARVCTGGGYLPSNITGLSGTSKGEITIDTTTGRLRAKAIGEPTNGYCDANGNVYLLPLAFTP